MIRPGGTPTGSVDLVAYLARYEATATSLIWPPPVRRTTRGSTWSPQVMSQPFGFIGCGTVANQALSATWRIRSASSSAVIAGCGGTVRSGWTGSMPSRRKMAWKWISPRRWNSATLAYDSLTRTPCVLGHLGELAAQGDDGAPPQLGGVRVPDHGAGVVVAVRAQRPAQAGVGLPCAAGRRTILPAVRAVAGLAPGPAPGDLPAGQLHPGVDRAEGGGGEGGEHARVDGRPIRACPCRLRARRGSAGRCRPGRSPRRAGRPRRGGPRTAGRSPRPGCRSCRGRAGLRRWPGRCRGWCRAAGSAGRIRPRRGCRSAIAW